MNSLTIVIECRNLRPKKGLRNSSTLRRIAGVAAQSTLIVAVLFGVRAHASGQLPPRPLPEKTFASFAACVDALRQMHADDVKGAKSDPVPIDGGATRQSIVDAKDVASDGPDNAHYTVENGWEFRVPGGDNVGNRWIKTNYSYDRTTWTCTGASLTGTVTSGFASPGFERVH